MVEQLIRIFNKVKHGGRAEPEFDVVSSLWLEIGAKRRHYNGTADSRGCSLQPNSQIVPPTEAALH
jgi:hypothetical protein